MFLVMFLLALLAFAAPACADEFSAAEDGDASSWAEAAPVDTPQGNRVVCGNFAFDIPDDATFEAIDTDAVDRLVRSIPAGFIYEGKGSEAAKRPSWWSPMLSDFVDRGELGRVGMADGTGVYVYSCRARMDTCDVTEANREMDETVLEERGDWLAYQIRGYSRGLFADSFGYMGSLKYEIADASLTLFCFSSIEPEVGFACGFVSLPSGYVSVVVFAFDMKDGGAAFTVVDRAAQTLEVGDGYTTVAMMRDSFAERLETARVLQSNELDSATAPLESSVYKDGTYESNQQDWTRAAPAVRLTIVDGKVVAVEPSDELAFMGYGVDAVEKLPDSIIATNGVEGLDAVAGATLTSEVILSATRECLTKAMTCPVYGLQQGVGDTNVELSDEVCGACHDGSAYSASTYSWNDQSFDFHDMSDELKAAHEGFVLDFSCQTCHAEKSVAACVTCHDGVFTDENMPEGWTIGATDEVAEAVAATADAAYADGEYAASSKGIGGNVPVTVTVEGGRIVSVEVGDNSETQGIGSKAIEQLPDQIVVANGTEGVDAVSGASITSKAIFTAVEDCLAQAS